MSESVPRSRPQRLRWQALWQLHPPVALVVRASQGKCLQTLAVAAKPSADRLHLRNLFMDGRRYYVQPQQDGFKLTSDNRLFWGGKRNRTRVAAVVFGKFSSPDNEITFIRLHSRVNILYLLSGLLVPIFFTSIVVYMPWPRLVISIIILLLFGLSLIGHRFDAALQVNEMIYFVQTALEDLPPVEISALPPSGPDVVLTDFREQWYRFYREQMEKGE
ncbi:MAG: hypothetical protein GC204_06620 [Chloroflexi bacterium]|nr:hypothetical protein [Chloroflexota bacterium]